MPSWREFGLSWFCETESFAPRISHSQTMNRQLRIRPSFDASLQADLTGAVPHESFSVTAYQLH